MKRLSVLALCLLVGLCGCKEQKQIAYVSYATIPLEEAVTTSDCVVVGRYVDTDDHPRYVYQMFDVTEVLFGSVAEDERLRLSQERTQEDMENIYRPGQEYILLLNESAPSIFEDGYYLATSVFSYFPVGGPYTMYGEEVFTDGETTFRDYVLELTAQMPDPAAQETPKPIYENPQQEMAAESQFLGYVTIQGVTYSMGEYTEVYECTVSELCKGPELNTQKDGTILLSLGKGTVSVGKTYFIGFDQAGDYSLIYGQSTLQSVIAQNDQAQIQAVLSYLDAPAPVS